MTVPDFINTIVRDICESPVPDSDIHSIRIDVDDLDAILRNKVHQAIRDAVAQETEQCASLAELEGLRHEELATGCSRPIRNIVDAIRARKP